MQQLFSKTVEKKQIFVFMAFISQQRSDHIKSSTLSRNEITRQNELQNVYISDKKEHFSNKK